MILLTFSPTIESLSYPNSVSMELEHVSTLPKDSLRAEILMRMLLSWNNVSSESSDCSLWKKFSWEAYHEFRFKNSSATIGVLQMCSK